MWPYILGVYPIGCSEEDRQAIMSQATEDYQAVLKQWKVVEARQKEIQIRAAFVTNGFDERRSPSPSLSSISAESSAETSPTHSPSVSNATGQTINGEIAPQVKGSPKKSRNPKLKSHDPELETSQLQLDAKGELFVRELFNIDKDIPRLDREYW